MGAVAERDLLVSLWRRLNVFSYEPTFVIGFFDLLPLLQNDEYDEGIPSDMSWQDCLRDVRLRRPLELALDDCGSEGNPEVIRVLLDTRSDCRDVHLLHLRAWSHGLPQALRPTGFRPRILELARCDLRRPENWESLILFLRDATCLSELKLSDSWRQPTASLGSIFSGAAPKNDEQSDALCFWRDGVAKNVGLKDLRLVRCNLTSNDVLLGNQILKTHPTIRGLEVDDLSMGEHSWHVLLTDLVEIRALAVRARSLRDFAPPLLTMTRVEYLRAQWIPDQAHSWSSEETSAWRARFAELKTMDVRGMTHSGFLDGFWGRFRGIELQTRVPVDSEGETNEFLSLLQSSDSRLEVFDGSIRAGGEAWLRGFARLRSCTLRLSSPLSFELLARCLVDSTSLETLIVKEGRVVLDSERETRFFFRESRVLTRLELPTLVVCGPVGASFLRASTQSRGLRRFSVGVCDDVSARAWAEGMIAHRNRALRELALSVRALKKIPTLESLESWREFALVATRRLRKLAFPKTSETTTLLRAIAHVMPAARWRAGAEDEEVFGYTEELDSAFSPHHEGMATRFAKLGLFGLLLAAQRKHVRALDDDPGHDGNDSIKREIFGLLEDLYRVSVRD